MHGSKQDCILCLGCRKKLNERGYVKRSRHGSGTPLGRILMGVHEMDSCVSNQGQWQLAVHNVINLLTAQSTAKFMSS